MSARCQRGVRKEALNAERSDDAVLKKADLEGRAGSPHKGLHDMTMVIRYLRYTGLPRGILP